MIGLILCRTMVAFKLATDQKPEEDIMKQLLRDATAALGGMKLKLIKSNFRQKKQVLTLLFKSDGASSSTQQNAATVGNDAMKGRKAGSTSALNSYTTEILNIVREEGPHCDDAVLHARLYQVLNRLQNRAYAKGMGAAHTPAGTCALK